jgi:hypothetical protein
MVVTPRIILDAASRELTACGIIAVVTLAILLLSKELASASEHPRFKLLSRNLDIGIIPLLSAFVFIVIMTVIKIID